VAETIKLLSKQTDCQLPVRGRLYSLSVEQTQTFTSSRSPIKTKDPGICPKVAKARFWSAQISRLERERLLHFVKKWARVWFAAFASRTSKTHRTRGCGVLADTRFTLSAPFHGSNSAKALQRILATSLRVPTAELLWNVSLIRPTPSSVTLLYAPGFAGGTRGLLPGKYTKRSCRRLRLRSVRPWASSWL
jgi:hypothetical protein